MSETVWKSTSSTDYSVASPNWSNGVPTSNSDVRIPRSTAAITAGLNQSAVTINSFQVEPGYSGSIGTTSAYLQLTIDTVSGFRYRGIGTLARFDFGSSPIAPEIYSSGAPDTDAYAVHIIGSALTGVTIRGGYVAIAPFIADTATVTDIVVNPDSTANVMIGSGTTRTTLSVRGGTVVDMAGTTASNNATNIHAGTYTINSATNGLTALTIYGGTANLVDSGTITSCTMYAGILDSRKLVSALTITTLTLDGNVTFYWDKAKLTIGTLVIQPGAVVNIVAS